MRTFVAILLLLVTAAFGACAWLYYFDAPYFVVVQPGVLYRDGFTGIRQFQNAYRQRPFKSVIDLRAPDDPAFNSEELLNERKFCEQNRIAFYSIPLRQKTAPSAEQSKQFLEIVGGSFNQPVLMHDRDGILSVGMLAALWQKESMGYPYEKTLAAVRLFNLPEPVELNLFIKRLYNKQ